MAEVIEDDQVRARYQFGGVMGVDDVHHPAASAVQDSDRAPDGGDIKGAPSCAVTEAVVRVAPQDPARTWPGMPPAPPSSRRANKQFRVRGSSAAAIPAPRILLPPSPCASVAAAIAAAPTIQIWLQRSRSCSSRTWPLHEASAPRAGGHAYRSGWPAVPGPRAAPGELERAHRAGNTTGSLPPRNGRSVPGPRSPAGVLCPATGTPARL